MDGTDLLLDKFRETTSSADDRNRVVGVNYPFTKPFTIPQLADFVIEHYLKPLSDDPRGYVLVNQSFSGHVGLHLSQLQLPGTLHGQVFVNCFTSPPGPSFIRGIPSYITTPLFRNQPPPWLVGRIFLGPNSTGMHTVQAAASQVEPVIMSQRLSLCLTENSWHLWRSPNLIPPETTLYLRGDDDVIISQRESQRMKLARPDIPWVRIPHGPHLLLQRYGSECGTAVNQFCRQLSEHTAAAESTAVTPPSEPSSLFETADAKTVTG